MKRLTTLALLIAIAGCSQAGSKQYLAPYSPPQRVMDANSQYFEPKADILFVIDNSLSMNQHQQNLANNIGLFTSVFLKNSILDYNIAVVSTDTEGSKFPSMGRFFGDVRVVNKHTPDADRNLRKNLMIGVGGYGLEASFDPILLALTDPLLTTWNADFLREDAALIVIFITDAEDQSKNANAGELYDFLLKLKNGDKRKVLGFGAIVPSGEENCVRDPSNDGSLPPEPKRIEEFLGFIAPDKSNIVSLCAPDYGTRLAQFAANIVNNVGSVIYLSRAPILDSIRVTYGNIDLPRDYTTGWSFNPAENSIRLGPKIDWSSQPNGSRMKIYYDAARFDEETGPKKRN